MRNTTRFIIIKFEKIETDGGVQRSHSHYIRSHESIKNLLGMVLTSEEKEFLCSCSLSEINMVDMSFKFIYKVNNCLKLLCLQEKAPYFMSVCICVYSCVSVICSCFYSHFYV